MLSLQIVSRQGEVFAWATLKPLGPKGVEPKGAASGMHRGARVWRGDAIERAREKEQRWVHLYLSSGDGVGRLLRRPSRRPLLYAYEGA